MDRLKNVKQQMPEETIMLTLLRSDLLDFFDSPDLLP